MVDIYDWNDLDAVRNDLTASYTLQNDLDKNTPGYVGIGDNFTPIGSGGVNDPIFNGQFDGQGYAIKDLVVSIDAEAVGLFGSINRNTTNTVVIENLSVSGDVTNTGTGNYTGGLVGFMDDSGTGTIRNCVSHVDVSSNGLRVGGLVGTCIGTITDSYATGSVDGDERVGGLVGQSDGGTIQTSYAVGSVTGNIDAGALVGQNEFGTELSDSYADEQTTGQTSLTGDTGGPNTNSRLLTTSEMQGDEASNSGNMDGFDFASTWDTVLTEDSDTTADGYPILQALDRENQLISQGILKPPNPIIVDGVAYDVFVDGTQYSAELQ